MKKHILTFAFKPIKCILTTSFFTVISRPFTHKENYYKTHFLKSLFLFTKNNSVFKGVIQYVRTLLWNAMYRTNTWWIKSFLKSHFVLPRLLQGSGGQERWGHHPWIQGCCPKPDSLCAFQLWLQKNQKQKDPVWFLTAVSSVTIQDTGCSCWFFFSESSSFVRGQTMHIHLA